MTDWEWPGQPPSDVLRVNAAAGREAVRVSDETVEVIAKSLDMSRRSGGAFDITYAAMRGLWKFDEDHGEAPAGSGGDRAPPPSDQLA